MRGISVNSTRKASHELCFCVFMFPGKNHSTTRALRSSLLRVSSRHRNLERLRGKKSESFLNMCTQFLSSVT